MDPQIIFKAHVATLAIVLVVVIAGVVRIIRAEMPLMRPDMMSLGASAKSIILIGYQLFAEHTGKLYSIWANIIIGVLEVAFWAAVAGMGIMSNIQFCTGDSLTVHCYIGWGINGASGFICILSLYSLLLAIKLRSEDRKGLGGRDNHKRLSSINLTDTQSWDHRPLTPQPYDSFRPREATHQGHLGY